MIDDYQPQEGLLLRNYGGRFMKIETRYNIGDEVWVMRKDRPTKLTIDGLRVLQGKAIMRPVIIYEFIEYNHKFMYAEIYLFPTKEELLKSL